MSMFALNTVLYCDKLTLKRLVCSEKKRTKQVIILKFALTFLAEELSARSGDLSKVVQLVSECFYTLAVINPELLSNQICIGQWKRYNKRVYDSDDTTAAIHSFVLFVDVFSSAIFPCGTFLNRIILNFQTSN